MTLSRLSQKLSDCPFLVNLERWCRLRGNLLFYFKTKEPWSEPLGVVVLEQCQVRIDPPMASAPLTNDGHFPFYLGEDESAWERTNLELALIS